MNLRIKLIPYERLKREDAKKLVKDLKEGTIILVDAKLDPKEEADLIEETMKVVSTKFSGIELSSMELSELKETTNFERFKNMVIERIMGKKRGLTIIGPAKIIRKIEKNPEELLLYM
ncbi:MAG: DUF2073 domain-containing protein [Candidatus Aenigmarchaeota archaeon]|nr:DUF2073 domain-containing protein [Candidatus Aenigmarchaeota archaeon]NIQ17526.1 DUF2073 domain-containing protein [Candidatus Aenigmarchaeota archaeon]NIS73104.1 DUF2073 domain-containing protein [Candidatus Aenigmarchaeota archaeon]